MLTCTVSVISSFTLENTNPFMSFIERKLFIYTNSLLCQCSMQNYWPQHGVKEWQVVFVFLKRITVIGYLISNHKRFEQTQLVLHFTKSYFDLTGILIATRNVLFIYIYFH